MYEKELEKYIREYIRGIGGKAYKFVSPGNPGVPDRLCLFSGGRVVFVELKRPGVKDGRSERQKRVFKELEELGFTVWVIYNKEGFKSKIKEFLGDDRI